jgi:hypothetical protein
MNYVGVDLHQKTSWFYVVDDKGNKLDSTNVTNSTEELKSLYKFMTYETNQRGLNNY